MKINISFLNLNTLEIYHCQLLSGIVFVMILSLGWAKVLIQDYIISLSLMLLAPWLK